MFWRSVVGKLAVTILLLVSFVLFVLTILLLEFFEGFHIQEAEKDILQTATKVSVMVERYEDRELIVDTAQRVKDPASRVLILFADDTVWMSDSDEPGLSKLDEDWLKQEGDLDDVLINKKVMKKQINLPDNDMEAMVVGTPVKNDQGAVFVFQSLAVVNQTKAETTNIILLAAGIAIILTTIFAFFLSTRITSPLIKMREAAFDLTQEEIGELAMAFKRMDRQLKLHINALRQEKEQLSSILSSMADGVVTLNRSGDIIIMNPPAERFMDDWYFEYNLPVNENNRQL